MHMHTQRERERERERARAAKSKWKRNDGCVRNGVGGRNDAVSKQPVSPWLVY
jgi:hypothetical protein